MTEATYDVRREETAHGGRYVIALGGGAEAEMVFHRSADGGIVITHTEVPVAFEGKGIAGHLMRAVIADARSEGFKITPLCSYVVAQFRRHPEWQDLIA